MTLSGGSPFDELTSMADDEALVERTRAAIKAKSLKRIADRKRKFKTFISCFLGFGVMSALVGLITYGTIQDQSAEAALDVRAQEFKEQRLVKDLRAAKQEKLAQKRKQEKLAIEQWQKQEKLADEQDFKYCHWMNVLVIMVPSVAKRAERIMDKADKPHMGQSVEPYEGCDIKHTCVFMVMRELEDILKDKGIRYQRKEFKDNKEILEFKKNLLVNVNAIRDTEPFVNW